MKILILFLFLGTAYGQMINANLNDYVDEVLPEIANWLKENGFDPMPIPDLCEGFSVKPLLITYHGELELTKGKLTGLGSLARSGDFTVGYIAKLLRIKGDFGFKDVGFTYDYLTKIMNIGPTGGVVGKVTKIGGVIDLLIDFNNLEVHLQDFYLHDIGKITVKLTGNILTDWLANSMINVITTLFKNVIVKVVESNLKSAIQDKINDINNSLHGGSKAFIESIVEEYHQQQVIVEEHQAFPYQKFIEKFRDLEIQKFVELVIQN